jgi:cysteine-rich repeat protein
LLVLVIMTMNTPFQRLLRVLTITAFCVVGALAAVSSLEACTKATPPICTPGNNVRCQCIDKSSGTHRCNADGNGFAECLVKKGVACDEDLTYVPPAPREGGAPKPRGDASAAVPVECGDDYVDYGEACDDGNRDNGDLCSASCVPVGDPPTAGQCPGMAVHLWDSKIVSVSASTIGYGNNHVSSMKCNDQSTGVYGADRIYAVTVHDTGLLIVTMSNTTVDNVLFARHTCDDSSSEFNCADTFDDGTGEKLEIGVQTDETVYIVVDGTTSIDGKGDIKFQLTP